VASQVYRLLVKTKRLENYLPPAPREVVLQCLGMYAIAAFIRSWTLWGVLPHRANAFVGIGCMPMPYSDESIYFFCYAFVPAFIGIPSVYLGFVAFKILRGGMLAPSQRSSMVRPTGQDRASSARTRQARALTIYFSRIIVVYLFMWVPIIFTLLFDVNNPWLTSIGGTTTHLMGVVSAGMALSKPDILLAVLGLFKCGGPNQDAFEGKLGRWEYFRRTLPPFLASSGTTKYGTSACTSDQSKNGKDETDRGGEGKHTHIEVMGSSTGSVLELVQSDAAQDVQSDAGADEAGLRQSQRSA